MRLGVYTDYSYARADGALHAEQSFSIFLAGLATRFERLVLIGRLNPEVERARYPLPDTADFVALPYYVSLARPWNVARSIGGSLWRFWRTLDDIDAVWLLGPHPLSLAFALLARARGRKVLLGVRQDLPVYVRRRHPTRRSLHLAASMLEAGYRGLARRCPTIVVGPALKHSYARAPSLLAISVSLIEGNDVVELATACARRYDGELTVLSVGRIDPEKNPLMLADVLSRLCGHGRASWRLVVCGEGPLEEPLTARLRALGVADRAELRGYVPLGEGMREVYEGGHFLLHTSWTEGLPQVVIEAFAAGLPVVATDVGGIREAVGDAAILIAPGDDAGAAQALRSLVEDVARREESVGRGLAYAHAHTLDSELDRLADFILRDGAQPELDRPLALQM